MGRRRRKRFSAGGRTGAQQPRVSRAPIADGADDAGPAGPSSSSAPRRQKRNPSSPPNDDRKRQKFDHAQDDVTSETKEQEENQNDPMRDDVNHPVSAEEEEEAPILVTCNRNEGLLYLSKLRVVVNERCRKKCIRTGNTWWTPNEFQVVSGRGAAKDWKRTVKHSGQRLKALLANGVLCLDASPPKCLCRPCCQLTETGRKTDSPEERREGVDDVGTASEAADVVEDVKRRSKVEGGVKKPGLRMIRVHRRGRRHVNDTVDRKSGPHALPAAKKKSRKSELPESDSNAAARDGRGRGRPRKSLVFRLSSASFEAVVCRPDGATRDSGANCPPPRNSSSPPTAPEEAVEGRCSDRDAASEDEAVPSDADDQTKQPTDNIPNDLSTGKSLLSDDVIADVTESFRREDYGTEISSSSREIKAEGCLITGNDESVSSSMTSFRCEKRVAKEPEEHASTRSAHAQPKSSSLVDIPEASNDASSTVDVTSGESVKSPNRDVVTDRDDVVTRVTVASVTSPPWSSATSATCAPRRKSAHLDAVIAELKRKKRSREGAVPASSSSSFSSSSSSASVSGGRGMEERRPMAAATLKAKLATTTCSDLMKMEMNVKMSLEAIRGPLASASSSGLCPAFEASVSSDVKPICLSPTRTGNPAQNPAAESKAGVRRIAKESSEGKWKTTAAPLTDHPGWRKDDGSGSEVGRRFWMTSGGMTSDMTSNSTMNISQLASMYGLNASPMTSFPLPPTQLPFPFFPPYLFMGFPLQPLLPPPPPSLPSGVPSSGSETPSLPVPVAPFSSAISGSAPQHRKRRTQPCHKSQASLKDSKSFPLMSSSSSPGTDSGLRRTALSSSSSSSSYCPSDLHLWRRLATDFSAHAWMTGSPLVATSKSHSGSTDLHPIWRPVVTSQSATSREYVEATTIPHRPFAHAQRQAEVTSVAGAGGSRNESSMAVDFTRRLCPGDKMEEADGISRTGKYSGDYEAVLDLSKK